MIDLTHVAAYTTPALVIVGGARWLVLLLSRKFEAKLNENADATKSQYQEVKDELVALTQQVERANHRTSAVELAQAEMKGILLGRKANE